MRVFDQRALRDFVTFVFTDSVIKTGSRLLHALLAGPLEIHHQVVSPIYQLEFLHFVAQQMRWEEISVKLATS